MAFRKNNGEYLGRRTNYQYTNHNSLNKYKKKKVRYKFVTLLLIILFSIGSIFLFSLSFREDLSDTDKSNYLLSSVFSLILTFYLIYRFIKSIKEEKLYRQELDKLKSDQEP